MSKEQRSLNMAKIRSKNTTPEKKVRSILHRIGYRFRIHNQKLPGTPDIVIPKYKSVIFVHGCFWHGHENCKRATIPKTNHEFWKHKITVNKERDRLALDSLKKLGYSCLVIWQCEMKNEDMLRQRLIDFLGGINEHR
ncbi:very short patch repair endonuclease [Desulfovibrio sp.]|uniref:very short patch repair endonuclease n=1 Tax=Desulfovibrio sp. TaxID=885 RepID=UPI003AB419FC